MKIAVAGCIHGELDRVYQCLERQCSEKGISNVDLLICCGDFQAVKDDKSLCNLNVPPKYKALKDFHNYYNGTKQAPVLTVFVGGNHEDPELLRDLYYGGWVAPKIFFLGFSGVVQIHGLRIAALSGIFKQHDYQLGYFEKAPFNESTIRSAYHIREFEVQKLMALSEPVDIVITHDWPRGVHAFGDTSSLIRVKPHFRHEVMQGTLGNPATAVLLKHLRPRYWFAAHLHVTFRAQWFHDSEDGVEQHGGSCTQFLALDKPIKGRNFLSIEDVGDPIAGSVNSQCHDNNADCPLIRYDPEWIGILKTSMHFMPLGRQRTQKLPTIRGATENERRCIDNLLSNSPCWPSWNEPKFTQPAEQRRFFVEKFDLKPDRVSMIADEQAVEIKFIPPTTAENVTEEEICVDL